MTHTCKESGDKVAPQLMTHTFKVVAGSLHQITTIRDQTLTVCKVETRQGMRQVIALNQRPLIVLTADEARQLAILLTGNHYLTPAQFELMQIQFGLKDPP